MIGPSLNSMNDTKKGANDTGAKWRAQMNPEIKKRNNIAKKIKMAYDYYKQWFFIFYNYFFHILLMIRKNKFIFVGIVAVIILVLGLSISKAISSLTKPRIVLN